MAKGGFGDGTRKPERETISRENNVAEGGRGGWEGAMEGGRVGGVRRGGRAEAKGAF